MIFIRIFAVLLLIWPATANAQSGLHAGVLPFLEAARSLEAEAALAPAAATHLGSASQDEIMRNALALMRETRLAQPVRFDAALRLMVAAVVRESGGDDRPVVKLHPDDVAAMQDRIGYPAPDDLVLYFFERGPHLNLPRSGEYTIIRLAPEDTARFVIEHSLLPPGSGFDRRQRLIPTSEDPVAKDPKERAKTFRLNMAAAVPLVMAARAYGVAARLPEETAIYALLIAKKAMDAVTAANPRDLRGISFAALATAERAIATLQRNGALSDDLATEAEAITLAYPSSAFFARSFPDAAEAYDSAKPVADDPVNAVWRAWGVALSRFAAGVREPADFQRVSDALVPEAEVFAGIFGRFLSALTQEDAAAYPDREAWSKRAGKFAPAPAEDTAMRQRLDGDFLRLMETIARPDMALPFLVARIDAERARPGRPFERNYLMRLAAFTRDLCHHISFRLSMYGTWERRDGLGYVALSDFLDNFHPEGRLTDSGEVVRPVPGTIPYPATDPEEDCAVMLPASGIGLGLLGTPGGPVLAPDFITWVREALDRETPRPSLAPFMKLAFLDWFASAFESLRAPIDGHIDWRYATHELSALTGPATARALTENERYHTDQRRHLALMLMVREALAERYGTAPE